MGSYTIKLLPIHRLNRELIVVFNPKQGRQGISSEINALNRHKSHYIARMRSNTIQAYHYLFESLEKPLLYTAPWWLDATCGEGGWDAVIEYDDDVPVAGLAFHKTSIRLLSSIITPPLTQWVSVLSAKELSSSEFGSLLSKLPNASIFDLTLKPFDDIHLQNEQFPIDLKYSFVLPYTEDDTLIRRGYNEGLRRNIRQAEKNYTIEASEDISGFLQLCKSSFQQQQMNPPHWLGTIIPQVYDSLKANHCGMLTTASFQGKTIAGVLTAWDHHTTYYLSGGRAEGDQATSAHALLLDHAIQLAFNRKTSFDFEGSMHPGIANFFQSFGAKPIPYWHLKKYRGFGKVWSALK